MPTSEILERLLSTLGDISRTVNVLTVAQKISEATTDEERQYLASALSNMLGDGGFNRNTTLGGSYSPEGFPRM